MGLFDVCITAIICMTLVGMLLMLGSIKSFPTIHIHHTYEQNIPPEQVAITEAQQKELEKQNQENKDVLSEILGNTYKLFGGVDDGEDDTTG